MPLVAGSLGFAGGVLQFLGKREARKSQARAALVNQEWAKLEADAIQTLEQLILASRQETGDCLAELEMVRGLVHRCAQSLLRRCGLGEAVGLVMDWPDFPGKTNLLLEMQEEFDRETENRENPLRGDV